MPIPLPRHAARELLVSAARMSCTWTVSRSITARPARISRESGRASAVWRDPCEWPTRDRTSPSNRAICASSLRTAEPHSPPRLEHRLNIRWRAGDDAQNFARRRLLLQRLAQFRVGGFQLSGFVFDLFKQIDVLDRDADLIAHRANQPDFFGDELSRLFAEAGDRPQKLFFRFDRKNREKTVIPLLGRLWFDSVPDNADRS